MSTPTLYANTELIALAWLSEFLPNGMYATQLPEDNSTWAASGFVVVNSMGGTSNGYVPVINAIVGFDCYAVNPTSNKSPWGKANNIAETLRARCYATRPHLVTLPGNYPPAFLYNCGFTSEPIRIPELSSSYAHYSVDVRMNWAPDDWDIT